MSLFVIRLPLFFSSIRVGIPLLVLCLTMVLTGCAWMGKAPPPPLPGKRVSVENYDSKLKPDPSLTKKPLILPSFSENESWAQSGGNASHNMGGVEIKVPLSHLWSKSIGNGSSIQNRLLSSPVMENNKIFTLDTSFLVTCFDFKTGERLWEESVASETRRAVGLGGGIAVASGHVVITTAVGDVVCLNETTGAMEWRVCLNYPQRSAPTIFDNTVYVLSLQNILTALDLQTGEKKWIHAGSSEVIGILGGAAPAVTQSTVIVPYSSGEIFALAPKTGEILWSDSLARPIFEQGVDALSHIRATPVIDNDFVYVMCHSGPLVSFDIQTGRRTWEQAVGGINSLAVAGDFLFVLSGTGDLLCLDKASGRVKWVCPLAEQLPQKESKETDSAPRRCARFSSMWGGPLLTNTGLLLTSDEGSLVRIDATTGAFIDQFTLGDPVLISPIAAQKNLITLSDTGYLTVWE